MVWRPESGKDVQSLYRVSEGSIVSFNVKAMLSMLVDDYQSGSAWRTLWMRAAIKLTEVGDLGTA